MVLRKQMKSSIKNESELIEIRYCYLLAIFICTLFAIFGFTRVLWAQVFLIPFIRIIHFYSMLPKLSKLLMNTMFFLLVLSFSICYLFFELKIAFNIGYTSDNRFFVKLFLLEILFTLIFHRFILFSKGMFLSKYLLPIYRIFKRLYVDIIVIIICYVIVYGFLPREYSVSLFKIYYLMHIDYFWYETFVYFYVIAFAIAGIWYFFGKHFMKNDIAINHYDNIG